MMPGLKEKIEANGYWRLNIRPRVVPEQMLSFAQCESVVETASVRLRGWDFPHISRRLDATHGYQRANDFVENWIDWEVHVEFWRMYRSSQFITYRALWEDLDEKQYNGRPRPEGKALSVGSAIYTVTEAFELAYRLAKGGLYEDGATVLLSLENTYHRQLWVNEPSRMPFYEEKRTGSQRIEITRSLTKASLEAADHTLSLEVLQELFGYFGWDVAIATISAQQTRFLNRQF